MIGMSNEQVLEHFKETFHPKTEGQLLQIDDRYTTLGKLRVPVLFLSQNCDSP